MPVRVRDESTGHEHNWPNDDVPEGLTVLDGEPTEDAYGVPRPPVYAAPKALEDQTVPELRDTAEKSGVDLAGATKKAEIVAKISEEQK